jgi:elongator complex protein 3
MRTPFRKNHGKITFVLYNKPSPCGGHCLYCFNVKGLTKSTTHNEDTELAKHEDWSGINQISRRFEAYNLQESIGLKCDLAVKGDSFANHDQNYLKEYVKEIYDFLNGNLSGSLTEASLLQREGKNRCVTFKVETRPDHITIDTCNLLLELGITTVEIGVQSLDENVLDFNKRGHGLSSIINATKLLRTFGFEVVYQVMIGLPGSTMAIDKLMLTELLWEEQYNPDALKIYPCLLLKKTIAYQKGLFDLYTRGLWQPISNKEYFGLLEESYPQIPRYVHINRIQRIIPYEKIEAGVNTEINRSLFSNVSKCLWQRSVAQKVTNLENDFSDFEVIYYLQGFNNYCFEAVFTNDVVLGYGRLTILSNQSAIIRDIRVLGNMLPVGLKNIQRIGCQHIGIGSSLINKMESVAINCKIQNIFVKPSFGTINWFENKGYSKIDYTYWGKKLNPYTDQEIEIPIEIEELIINKKYSGEANCTKHRLIHHAGLEGKSRSQAQLGNVH